MLTPFILFLILSLSSFFCFILSFRRMEDGGHYGHHCQSFLLFYLTFLALSIRFPYSFSQACDRVCFGISKRPGVCNKSSTSVSDNNVVYLIPYWIFSFFSIPCCKASERCRPCCLLTHLVFEGGVCENHISCTFPVIFFAFLLCSKQPVR